MTPIQALEEIRAISIHLPYTDKRNRILAAADKALTAPKQATSPPLTLAQLHADELVALLEVSRAVMVRLGQSTHVFDAMLAKVRPPQPPTLEEALDIIGRIGQNLDGITMPGTIRNDLKKLLDRVPK